MRQGTLDFRINVDRSMLCCPRCDWEIDLDVQGNIVSIAQATAMAEVHLDHCRRPHG